MCVTALIVNWNTRDCLLALLASLREAGPLQTVVVDNASADGSVEAVGAAYPDIMVLALGENLGYAEANNLAACCATGDYLLFLNPDTILPPGAPAELARFLDEHPKAALAAPRLVLPDGSTQASVRGMPTPRALLSAWLGLDRLFPRNPALGGYRMRWFDYSTAQPAPQPMASAWMVRRAAWEAIGPFDPSFPLFWNDVDWCLRAQQAGWETWYTPEPAVRHEGGASTRQVKKRATLESHRALVTFYRKYYRPRLGPVAFALCRALIMLVGHLRALRSRT
ncbi:MAG TPA: glycosyltransferase family 2 protein [Armatimonadota bacterium]|jgi:hypothetical protein